MPVKTMVVEGPPDSAVECRDCGKSFASKKNLRKHHQSSCKARKKNPQGSVAKEEDQDASREIKRNFLAHECDVCCRLFKSEESLENHMAEHSDVEEEETVENLSVTDTDSEGDIVQPQVVVVTQQVLATITSKADLLEHMKSRETFLTAKLAKVKARFSETGAKDSKEVKVKLVSHSLSHITKLRNDVVNIKKISLKKEELEARLSKLKNLIEKKETKNLVQNPQEEKSLVKKMNVAGSFKRKSESKFTKSNKKSRKEETQETGGSDDKESKKIISMSVYKEITEKISGLPGLELELSRLKFKLEKVSHLVSKKVQEGKESSEEIKTEPLTPEKAQLTLSPEPEVTNETEDAVKPEKKFEALRGKLERQLVRRSRINSQLEAMLGQGEGEEEAAARRLEARLAREATVKEVMRRQEERRQAERDRELEQQQHSLSSQLEQLRTEIRALTEQNSSPENSASKKKSRKELRKHLQGNH